MLRALIAAALVATPLFVAARAHADTSDFVDDIHSAGIVHVDGNAGLLLQGFQVCARLDGGATPAQVSNDYWLANNVSAGQSGSFVGIAVRDLCPWDTQPFFGRGTVA